MDVVTKYLQVSLMKFFVWPPLWSVPNFNFSNLESWIGDSSVYNFPVITVRTTTSNIICRSDSAVQCDYECQNGEVSDEILAHARSFTGWLATVHMQSHAMFWLNPDSISNFDSRLTLIFYSPGWIWRDFLKFWVLTSWSQIRREGSCTRIV